VDGCGERGLGTIRADSGNSQYGDGTGGLRRGDYLTGLGGFAIPGYYSDQIGERRGRGNVQFDRRGNWKPCLGHTRSESEVLKDVRSYRGSMSGGAERMAGA